LPDQLWLIVYRLMEEDFKFTELTKTIIGCAMKVHTYFGSGFHEVVYQRSLLIEFRKHNLNCGSEIERKVFYKDHLVGKKRLDIIVENSVLLELKATSELDRSCFNRVINYLKVFDLEVGLLLNFGTTSLQFKRFIRSKNLRNPS
jgi:GxxExxY protein